MNWLQIHITVQQSQVEICESLLLSLGAVSVTLDDAEDQALLEPLPGETPLWDNVIVTGIFQQDEEQPIDADALSQFISTQIEHTAIRSEVIEDQAWERAWMDYYEPIQVADNLWIVPEWLEAPNPEVTNIKLDPGLAFGTGNHASTFLSLQWLASIDLKDKVVIDYGCGSGILGVAALLLGAKYVYATDIDPQAVLATKQNAELNGVANRLWVGLPEEFEAHYQDKTEILVANILAKPLMMLVETFYNLTVPNAQIALAGLIEEQIEDVKAAYAPYFEITGQQMREENWCRLSGHRKA
ncbi:50S ribosomal protein L11 methyltransferase [Acinetobacter sp. A3.8]|uniref:Ribosomal protein L11 methyltransferase n=1 Tax=Acinetobacter sedimenti TaxID=2919922 RepID=A0A9X1WXS6_9GAMM|nr:50S ribosomal protein L11 methyltransferase [Acinetobacter sedimenti]MCJ8147089.1 50S ribosomal protein L11 methyltransferase [Acinetobacter sedimenti]